MILCICDLKIINPRVAYLISADTCRKMLTHNGMCLWKSHLMQILSPLINIFFSVFVLFLQFPRFTGALLHTYVIRFDSCDEIVNH